MLGLGGNKAPMNNGALNLGVQGQQGTMAVQSQNPWANQQTMASSASKGLGGWWSNYKSVNNF